MSDNPPNNNELLNFIAATVESLRDDVNTIRSEMATKTELARVELKLDQMATKSDLAQVEARSDRMEAKIDQMATKSDLARLELKLEAEVVAIRGDIEQVHLRLDSIERALSSRLGQIETEVSRLRSVVYLLVKDKPEMLRLLGQVPSASDEGRL